MDHDDGGTSDDKEFITADPINHGKRKPAK
jgi:hypothetical protein